MAKAQAQATGKPFKPDSIYVDIYKEKPIKVVAKVLVPVKEHPRVRFSRITFNRNVLANIIMQFCPLAV